LIETEEAAGIADNMAIMSHGCSRERQEALSSSSSSSSPAVPAVVRDGWKYLSTQR